MIHTAELVGSRAVAHYVLVDAKNHHAEDSKHHGRTPSYRTEWWVNTRKEVQHR